MTAELEAVPTDKASRIKARKESMTAGETNSERKGTREGPGRSFGTLSTEAHTRIHAAHYWARFPRRFDTHPPPARISTDRREPISTTSYHRISTTCSTS